MQALSARVTLGRPATARVAKKQQRPLTVASATAQLSAEQKAFLERKARESRSPAPVETRGRSAPRPRSVSPVGRPSSRTPAPASSSSFGYSAPAAAAPAAGGLSAEQRQFLERKARESRSPAPVETRGRSAPRPRSASPRPTSRAPSSYSAPAASYSAPAAAAPAGGLSAEQREFLERKARESRSPAPVETRGRSAPRPRAASPRPTSRTPAPASYSAPAASYSAPAAAAPAANGLSAEQAEFLRRKAQETRSYSAPVETRGRSSVTRASARPSSRTPTPVSNSGVRSAMSSGASSSGLSAEQQAFLERKARESRSPAPAAASSASFGSSAAGLSAEQRDFLARKAAESRRSTSPAPTRGRSSAPRRRY